jgi:putative endonuclease
MLTHVKRFVLDLAQRIRRSRRPGFLASIPGPSDALREAVPLTRRDVGARGEKLALDYLNGLGYKTVQANFRCRQGEIDIIARHGECLVFVEVRTKRSGGFGTPEESITLAKKEKLISLAHIYLQTLANPPPSWRIDVVAVELAPDGSVSRLEHIENALS